MSSTDTTPIYSEFSRDEDMLDLVEEFVENLAERINAIENALDSNDIDELKQISHQLKGASGGYGFNSIGLVAGELEALMMSEQKDADVKGKIDELLSMCRRATATPPPA